MRLVIVDHTLRHAGGHSLDYARVVAEDARRAGFDVLAVVDKAANKRADLPFEALAWFDHGPRGIAPWRRLAWNTARVVLGEEGLATARRLKARSVPAPSLSQVQTALAREYADALSRLWPRLRIGTGDRVFFPTLNWAEAIEAAKGFPAGTGAECLIMLRFDPPTEEWDQHAMRVTAQARADVRWTADTAPLAKAYGAILHTEVIVARIPVDLVGLHEATGRRSRSPVRVSYLGEARREKGLHLLADAISAVLEKVSDVEFLIQLQENMPGGEPGIGEQVKKIESLPHERLTIMRGPLHSSAFFGALGGTHVLLLPYEPNAYRLRSSGLAVMALASGAAIVSPRDESWLSCAIEEERAIDRWFAYDETCTFAEAILQAINWVRTHGGVLNEIAPRVTCELAAPWSDPL